MTSLETSLKNARTDLPALRKKRDAILVQIADAENTIRTLESAGVTVPAEPAPAAPATPVGEH